MCDIYNNNTNDIQMNNESFTSYLFPSSDWFQRLRTWPYSSITLWDDSHVLGDICLRDKTAVFSAIALLPGKKRVIVKTPYLCGSSKLRHERLVTIDENTNHLRDYRTAPSKGLSLWKHHFSLGCPHFPLTSSTVWGHQLSLTLVHQRAS